jgi:hypothetical protein
VVPSATYYASDAFTGADTTTLALHTPDAVAPAPAGASWEQINGASPSMQILGNRAINNTTDASFHILELIPTAPGSADHSVIATYKFFTNFTDSSYTGVCARMSAGQFGAYRLEYVQSASPFWRLLRVDDAFALSQLGANVPYAFPALGTEVTVEIRAVAGSVKAIVGGVTIVDQTDGSPLTGKNGGLNALNATAPAAATGVHVVEITVRSPT